MDFISEIYFLFLIIPEEDEWLKTGDPLTAGYFTSHLNKPLNFFIICQVFSCVVSTILPVSMTYPGDMERAIRAFCSTSKIVVLLSLSF